VEREIWNERLSYRRMDVWNHGNQSTWLPVQLCDHHIVQRSWKWGTFHSPFIAASDLNCGWKVALMSAYHNKHWKAQSIDTAADTFFYRHIFQAVALTEQGGHTARIRSSCRIDGFASGILLSMQIRVNIPRALWAHHKESILNILDEDDILQRNYWPQVHNFQCEMIK
jgi:hypothetical protein